MDGVLFFDVETNGLPNMRLPHADKSHPHIVQLAAALCDSSGEVMGTMNSLIKPDGWTIPDHLVSLHGISTARCESFGIPMSAALETLKWMECGAGLVVAHNREFDDFLLQVAALRCANCWLHDAVKRACTAEMSTPICKLPPTERMVRAGYTGFKKPKLIEAHRVLFGEGFDGAHDAMADVLACKRVYFEIKRRQATGTNEEATQ